MDRWVTFENDCLLPREWVGAKAAKIASVFWGFNGESFLQLLNMVQGMRPQATARFADVHVSQGNAALNGP